MKMLLLCGLLAGCVTAPVVSTVEVAGRQLTEVRNHEDGVPGCREPWAGCYVAATNTAYYRPHVGQDTVAHERAHADGMAHSPWQWNFWRTEQCSQVIQAGGHYKVGQTICVTPRGERVF